jgi:teichoic acid transport system ATP-binding protein
MGYSKEEMDAKVDAILEFANIGEFIHQPVKMYSSGMFARLAFSVSINVDPDILIVDEALSVGDIAFQMKCFKKFQEFQENGKTILFVTHALDTVIRYCNRGIVVDSGQIVLDGSAKEAVDTFKKITTNSFQTEPKKQLPKAKKRGELLKKHFTGHESFDNYGNHKAQIIDYGITDLDGNPLHTLDFDGEFEIVMRVHFNEAIEEPIFAYTVKDLKGLELTGTNTMMQHFHTGSFAAGEEALIRFRQKANFQIGKYALSFGCVQVGENGIEVFERVYDAVLFEVIGSSQMVGLYSLHSNIGVEKC